jgi:hypothetical protein
VRLVTDNAFDRLIGRGKSDDLIKYRAADIATLLKSQAESLKQVMDDDRLSLAAAINDAAPMSGILDRLAPGGLI